MAEMTRREFFLFSAAVWTVAVAAPVVAIIHSNPKQSRTVPTFDKTHTFGYVSAVEHDTRNLKVYLGGEDVSAQCSAADDREGWVYLVMVNKEGHITAPLEFKRIYGNVVIKRREE